MHTTETSLMCLSKTAARLSFQLQKRATGAGPAASQPAPGPVTSQPTSQPASGPVTSQPAHKDTANKDFDYYYNRYKPFLPWLALTTGGVGILSKLLGGDREKSPSLGSYLPWLLMAGLGGYGAYTGWGQNKKKPVAGGETSGASEKAAGALNKGSSRDELLTAARMAIAPPTTMVPGAPDTPGIPGTPMTNDTPGVSNPAPVKPVDATPTKPPAAPGGPTRGPASTQKNP